MGCDDELGRDLIGETAKIEGVEAISGAGRVLGVNDDVQSVAAEVNHRRGVDADIRPVVGAAERITDRGSEVRLEQGDAACGVDRIDGVALGGDIHHIVLTFMVSGRDGDIGNEERLPVHLVVENNGFQLGE